MVSTRHHPRPFPEPILPPSRSPHHASESASPTREAPPTPTESASSTVKRRSGRSVSRRQKIIDDEDNAAVDTPTKAIVRRTKSAGSSSPYTHSPPSLFLTWAVVSLILVTWDTGYVLLRPHTMPGGKIHSPIWTPYALYGTVDYNYGWPAWNAKLGFTAAQASMNAIESLFFGFYLFIVAREVEGGLKAGIFQRIWRKNKRIEVRGRLVPEAVLLCFAATRSHLVRTLSLTHTFQCQDSMNIIWIVPNGAWIVLPAYMLKVLGLEILKAMRGGLVKQR